MSDRDWFESLFVDAAHHFGKFHSQQFTDWETRMIRRSIESKLLDWDNHLFRVSTTSKPYSMFTINREYFIQFAAFASLVYEYGYPPENCLIEYHSMDVMVKKAGLPFICVETKVKDIAIDNLLKGINKYRDSVVPVPINTKNDALQKANYLFKDKPAFFWLLNANRRLAFSVRHHDSGFSLIQMSDIPKYDESDSFPPVGLDGKPIIEVSEEKFDTIDPLPLKGRWNESRFIEALSEKDGDAVQIAKNILSGLQIRKLVVRWGTGKTIGSFGPVITGFSSRIFTVYTNGMISFHFQDIMKTLFKDEREKGRELLNRFNQIPTVKIPEDAIDKYPSILVSALKNEADLKKFFDAIDWLIK